MAGKSNLAQEYVEVLPLAPRDFLQAHRAIALVVFSAERPPVACPLKDLHITIARSKISIRGGSLMRSSLHVVSLRVRLQPHPHVCTHIYAAALRTCMYNQDLASTLTRTRWRTRPQTHKGREFLHGTACIGRPYHSLAPLALLRLSLSFVRYLLSQKVVRVRPLCSHDSLRLPQSHLQSYPMPLLQQKMTQPATCQPSWTPMFVQPWMAPVQRFLPSKTKKLLQPLMARLITSMEIQPSLPLQLRFATKS